MIVDTGPLYAAADNTDNHHTASTRLLDTTEQLIVPAPVLVEVCQLISGRLGPHHEAAFLRTLPDSTLHIEHPTVADLRRAGDLVAQYQALDIGYVDATVIATAERLGETRVATVDHRHFRVVRPLHTPAFELLP